MPIQPTVGELKSIGKILLSAEAVHDATDVVETPVLGRSMIAHLIWKLYADQKIRGIAETRKARHKERKVPFQGQGLTGKEAERAAKQYIASLPRFIRQGHATARRVGKPTFYFLQPTQYLPDMKPLTAEEAGPFSANPNNKREVPKYYPDLIASYDALHKQGLPAWSLVDVFQTENATVYKDDCCHFNSLGYLHVANGMAEVISSSPQFDGMVTRVASSH